MPIFTDKMQLQDCFTALFEALRSDPNIGPRGQASGLVVRFLYTDPDTSVIIDCRPSPLAICWDQQPALTPEERSRLFVDLSMSSDVAHRFWLGRVNLVAAITRGIVRAKGPIPSIMRFLPIIKPAFEIYPRILHEKGLDHLIAA